MSIGAVLSFFKMLYNILWFTTSALSFLFNSFWLCCTLASAGIPWFTLLLIIVCIASKFVKLRNPNEKFLLSLLGGDIVDDISYWPIANRGAAYDAPENSAAAIKKCAKKGFRNILLDAGITACGEIVILHGSTLERAGLSGNINQIKFDSIQNIDVSELHPLGSQFEPEKIISLANLLTLLEGTNVTIFLLISDASSKLIEKLKTVIKTHESFTRRIIVCSKSPIAIYQLRKVFPELICGFWTDKSPNRVILKTSTLFTSIYGAVFRNIIAPVIGISIVFIHKDEFNLHISELWRNVGVRPVVYNVNSPNEKRYFQKVMKTQYLTDSLRSEPQLFVKA